jgi:hypothetical protein
MYAKRTHHCLASLHRFGRAILHWIEEPGNVLAALGLSLALILLSLPAPPDDAAAESATADADFAVGRFWTLHDAVLIEGSATGSDNALRSRHSACAKFAVQRQ